MKLSKNKEKVVMLFVLSISFIFIMIGCKKTNSKTDYGFQIPIDKFYWGMTIEEVEKITEFNDVDDTSLEDNEQKFILKQLSETKKIFGYDAIVTLGFEDGSINYGINSNLLERVSFTFSNIDHSKLKDKINKELKVQGNSLDKEDGVFTTWLSEDTLGEIKDTKLVKQLNDLWISTYKDELTEEQIKYLHDDAQSINYITLVLNKEDDSATLNYYGSNAMLINLLSGDTKN